MCVKERVHVCVCVRSKKALYSPKGQDCAKWNNNRLGAREEVWGRLRLTVGGGGEWGLGDDCNLSLLFQHRAAGERRCWGLCRLHGPVEAQLSITEPLAFFMGLGSAVLKTVRTDKTDLADSALD